MSDDPPPIIPVAEDVAAIAEALRKLRQEKEREVAGTPEAVAPDLYSGLMGFAPHVALDRAQLVAEIEAAQRLRVVG